MKIREAVLTVVLLAGTLVGSARARAASEVRYTPKLSVRTHAGLLRNVGSLGGATISAGGLGLGYQHFFSSRVSLGAEYRADFDYRNKNVPLRGFYLGPRWYLIGRGTREVGSDLTAFWERLPGYGVSVGAQIGFNEFFLGTNSDSVQGVDLTGSFLSFSTHLGMDWTLSSHWQLSGDLHAGLFSFSGSDDRFKVVSYILSVGMTYLW